MTINLLCRRTLLSGLAGVVALGGAFAAGEANAADPIKLTWLATARQSPGSSTPEAKQWYETKLNAFLKAHPGVEVEVTTQGTDINAAMTRLQEQVGTGRAPDFASLNSFFLSRFYDKLQPLDAFYPTNDVDDFIGFAKAGMRGPDGKLKAVWVNTDVRALFYRTDLVPTPPKTWDELLATADALKSKVATPYVFPGGRGEAAVMEHLPMFWALGGELVDGDGKPVFGLDKNRDAWIKILDFMKKAVDSGASTSRVANYGSENDMYPELMRGQTAMFLGGSWMPGQMRDLGDKNAWAVAPVPMPGTVGPATAVGGWTYGIFTQDPERQKLIVEFMNSVVASPDGMAGAVTALSNLPTRKSVAARDTPYFSNAFVKTYTSMLGYGRARPGAAIYPAISKELQVAISSVITGQKSAASAVDEAFAKVKQQQGG